MDNSLGWKVTVNGASACCPCGFALEYQRDQWVKPHPDCGPLAVFVLEAFDEARKFSTTLRTNCPQSEIDLWKCEYMPVDEWQLWVPATGIYGREVKRIDHCPIGTSFANAVRLTELHSEC